MRAILLARATVTSIFGLRANICASHDPLGAPRRLACRTTALAPMINRRRIVRSPRFETAPSFCLPPVDFCNGVSPSQAAKWRPAGEPLGRGHERSDCRRGNWPLQPDRCLGGARAVSRERLDGRTADRAVDVRGGVGVFRNGGRGPGAARRRGSTPDGGVPADAFSGRAGLFRQCCGRSSCCTGRRPQTAAARFWLY